MRLRWGRHLHRMGQVGHAPVLLPRQPRPTVECRRRGCVLALHLSTPHLARPICAPRLRVLVCPPSQRAAALTRWRLQPVGVPVQVVAHAGGARGDLEACSHVPAHRRVTTTSHRALQHAPSHHCQPAVACRLCNAPRPSGSPPDRLPASRTRCHQPRSRSGRHVREHRPRRPCCGSTLCQQRMRTPAACPRAARSAPGRRVTMTRRRRGKRSGLPLRLPLQQRKLSAPAEPPCWSSTMRSCPPPPA